MNNNFIVIPVHNRVEYTRSCLRSLDQQTMRDFVVVVVDDGSTDGTSETIKKEFPDVVLIKGDGNLWWTRAVNKGVEYALGHNAKYIVTLNDDIILPVNFISEMTSKAAKNPNALLGGVQIDSDAKAPTYGGKIIDWKLARYRSILDYLGPEDFHGLHEVTHLPGRTLLIPAEVFRTIGLFDERQFPQTIADIDFTYRAHTAGYKVFVNYDAPFEVYPDSKGGLELRAHKSLRNYWNHLFGIKGKGNLDAFIRFGLKNCPRRFLPTFLIIGVSRRIGGYLFEWLREIVKPRSFKNSEVISDKRS